MLQADSLLLPWRIQRKAFRPFQNYDPRLVEKVLKTQGFEIVEALNTVQVCVIDLFRVPIDMDQRKRRTCNFLFAGSSEAGNDAFRQGSFSAAKISRKQH